MTQKDALEILKMGHNCFLTGPAGSGKTFVLNQYINFLKEKGVEVGITASTGIAATHMGGTTIHSWSGLGIKDTITSYDLDDLYEKKYLRDRFKSVQVLVIDEISMLHHFRLDLIDMIARHFKKVDAPFGGIQVVLCGDFFQLPPVFRAGERESDFTYMSETWEKLELKICYLEEQHRQKDADLLNVLNEIRDNKISDRTIKCLEGRCNIKVESSSETTRLHTHNIDVDTINDRELAKIDREEFVFTMTSKGNKNLVEILKKSCLSPERLRLKVGARVIFVKNNFEAGYANGTLGKVIECGYFGPRVLLKNNKVIDVEPATWVIEEEGKIKAEIKQYPLRLAWAITVHKSQGMSLDFVEVDLSKSFEKGMGYVALSRVRTLQGLKLVGFNENALQVNGRVLEFDKKLRKKSDRDTASLVSMSKTDIEARQKEFLNKILPEGYGLKTKKRKVSASDKVKEMIKEGMGLKEIAKIKNVKLETVISNIEKAVEKDPDFDISCLRADVPTAKFKKIYMVFKDMYGENRDFLLSPVKNKLGSGYTFEELRIVRLFVKKNI